MRAICSLLSLALLSGALAAQPAYTTMQYGMSCGPVLDATFTSLGGDNAQLNVALTKAWPKSHSLTYWGVNNIVYPFPNGCTLYTLPVWQHPAMISAEGESTWQRAWPASIYGYFNLQAAVFRFDAAGALEFELSNAVRIAHE